MRRETIEQFRSVLGERFGWRLDNDASQLAALLSARVRPGQTADQYIDRLRAESPGSPELRHVAEALAVSETYFFRNREQFAALADVALPSVIARRPAGPIRILSAGCASGEEPYSLAMTIRRLRRQRPVPPAEIVGIDVSRRAIEKARKARYSRWALRGLPEDLRDEFFVQEGAQAVVRPEVVAMVRFEERNLLSVGTSDDDGPWDVVFFRNTCMYFMPDAARQIVGRLASRIGPGGFLFLGHAENLRGLSEAFDLRHTHETFYYVRRDGAVPPPPPPVEPVLEFTGPEPPLTTPADDEWFYEIGRATDRIASLVGKTREQPVERRRDAAPSTPPTSLAVPLGLLAEERYEEALAAVGTAGDPDRLLLRAVLLTHLGRFDEARETCHRVLGLNSMQAGAHYVLALCEERAGRLDGVVMHDEVALHLDPTFSMAHLHLGVVARRRGDLAAAARHIRAARALLLREDSARILLFGGGLGRHALLQMCNAHLASLGA